MNALDAVRYAFHSIERSPSRTALMLLAMAIGVAAVLLLTGLGEAARRYVTNEFASLGTNLVIVLPGKSETSGGALGASFGGTTRDLTIEDAQALTRHPYVKSVAPLVIGAAGVQYGGLEREAVVYGTTTEMQPIRRWAMSQGMFLPIGDWTRAISVCVIGQVIETELFGGGSALGRWLRIGDSRFRVVGVLGTVGRSMGMDVESTVMIPVASSMALFNTESLFRILIESESAETMEAVKRFTRNTIKQRHHGEEDVTVITQDAVLQTFDQIFNALTMTIGGIGAISLAVAGILIMNVMLVSVAQRTGEVGLLKAVGATPHQIVLIFLLEAALLSTLGAIIGLAIGLGGAWLITQAYPTLNMSPPAWAVVAGVVMALVTGIVFGIMPARRAAALDPVTALAKG
jgi:putative ABC transport system permease protein